MEKAKYKPDEIDRMIDEEISRIEAANSKADGDAVQCSDNKRCNSLCRLFNFLPAFLKRRKQQYK